MYRGINDIKKDYQRRANRVKDEKGDLITGCHNISARWRNHFPQLFNVHGVNDDRETETHTYSRAIGDGAECLSILDGY